ncbi:MAG: AraC family transcriptional regulator [Oscillospiraceae bacterium]|jgi:AraC family transcriptional regulator|nr:AraC family transcriptional regulator [Oscillospiraceae bacterium]
MSGETPVFRSLEYIEARITEKLTVENIAGSVYFSRFHYQRLFREIVGESVMEYVTKRKLTLAGGALLDTDAAVLDIALKYGYDSHEGFTRSFKAYMGVTPTEYRKYGLAAIAKKTVKERLNMSFSKTTDEIIRELNEFVAKAKETAEYSRKNSIPQYRELWNYLADATDALAGRIKSELARVTSIAERPDEISGMFKIIEVIDGIAFESNLISFSAKMTVARGQPEDIERQQPLLQRYGDLAYMSAMKAMKITEFFNELAALVVGGMKKTAAAKIEETVQIGETAAGAVAGVPYIQAEIQHVVEALTSTPLEQISADFLEDLLFRLTIIEFTAGLDLFRNPEDKKLFERLSAFKESMRDTMEFYATLIKPENTPAVTRTADKILTDVAFQCNLYLFYLRGEAEKLGGLLNDGEKAALDTASAAIDEFIRFAHKAAGKTDYQTAAEKLLAIHNGLLAGADKLSQRGGPIRLLAGEFKGLATHLTKLSQ